MKTEIITQSLEVNLDNTGKELNTMSDNIIINNIFLWNELSEKQQTANTNALVGWLTALQRDNSEVVSRLILKNFIGIFFFFWKKHYQLILYALKIQIFFTRIGIPTKIYRKWNRNFCNNHRTETDQPTNESVVCVRLRYRKFLYMGTRVWFFVS